MPQAVQVSAAGFQTSGGLATNFNNPPALGSSPVGVPVAAGLGASPATFTNNTNNLQLLYINAGASQTTTLTKAGVVIATAVVPAATGIPLVALVAPGQTCIVTFSAALTSQFVDTA